MSQEIVVQPQPRAWLENSVLQPYVSRYGAHLRRGRYAPSTQRVYLCCVAHFAHWLTGERCGLRSTDCCDRSINPFRRAGEPMP